MAARETQETLMSPHNRDILDTPIIGFSAKDRALFRDILPAVFIAGDSSSGKSSTSRKQFLCGLLRANVGLVLFTIKPSDRDDYLGYIGECSRDPDDVVVFNEKSGLSFDCLAHEWTRTVGRGSGDVESIIDYFDVLLSLGKSQSGGGENKFWDLAAQQAERHAIHLIKLADEPLSIVNIHKAISSFPDHPGQHDDESWSKNSYTASLIDAIRARKDTLTEEEWQNLEAATAFVFGRWAALDERLRGSISMTFSGLADKFQFHPLKRMFASGRCDFVPEDVTHRRKIHIFDFPLNEYGRETARFIQTMLKLTYQRSFLRHAYAPGCCNGAALVQDEFQMLLSKFENYWVQTARSSGVASLYITQNILNVAEEFNETQPGSKTRAFLNNLPFKILHRSTCPDTCTYFSDVIGKRYRWVENFGSSIGQAQGGPQTFGGSRQLTYIVDPIEFTRLARPDGVTPLAAAYVYRGGDSFHVTKTDENPEGENYLKVYFSRE
jgi:hypothetical protein